MRVAVAILLVSTVLAGCIVGDDQAEPATDPTGPDEPATTQRPPVQTYRGDGSGDAPADPASTPGDTGIGQGGSTTPAATPPIELALPKILETGYNGAEPNMGITSSGAVFVSAGSSLIRSLDKGETWTVAQRHNLLNNDPMMWADPYTDWVYHAPMFPTLLCASIYRSSDDGETWDTVPSPNCGRNVYDHQKLASGPAGPDGTPFPLSHDSVLYVCYNAVTTTQCAASYDNGETWPQDIPAAYNDLAGPLDQTNCGSGQNGHPTVRADGVVAFGKTWTCETPYLVYSTDSGESWNIRAAPADKGSSMLDPEVAFTPDGTTYLLYRGSDQLVYLLRTDDLGETWDGPFLASPPGLTVTVFGAMAAGEDGRIAFSFLGTDDPKKGTTPSNAPPDTVWHLYMVHSSDADADVPTFTSYQATPEDDPVQIGCVWLGGGSNPCRNMLDFIDGAVDPNGTFYTVFTDGCTQGCAGKEDATEDDSRSQATTLARLDGFDLWPNGSPFGLAGPPKETTEDGALLPAATDGTAVDGVIDGQGP